MKFPIQKLLAATGIILLFVSTGCGHKSGTAASPSEPLSTTSNEKASTEKVTACTEPRSMLCTMNYDPVCGEKKDGSHKTYANGCGACADSTVIKHRPGECP